MLFILNVIILAHPWRSNAIHFLSWQSFFNFSMDSELKGMLEKALASQTWNNHLAETVIAAIEREKKTIKPSESTSALTIALEREKRNKFEALKSVPKNIVCDE